jgi:trk system potassium uptake protein TrkA
MLIAVTAGDEVNLVACKIAADLYNIPTRIARVRNVELQQHPALIGESGFRASHVIFPEQTVTDYLLKLIEFPEALQVLEFADGRASLIAVRAFAGGPLVSHPIKDLRRHIPNVDTRIVAIFRNDASVRVDGDTFVQPGDEVFFLAASQDIRRVLGEMRRMDKPVRRVIIAGGGNIGLRLARALDTGEGLDIAERFNVRIIESNKRRAESLARQLSSEVLVLQGDATDEDLLTQEGVQDADLFIALTNDDENNIMSSLLAKRLGARRVIALINRKSYGDLMQGGQIDIAVSPSYATLSALLRFVRRGDVVAAHSLRRGAAEALELIVHGDEKSSRIIGKPIEQIELPRGATIGAVVRGSADRTQVLMAHHDVVVQAEDHLIVFVENKRIIPRVEKLFSVGLGFF